MKKIDKPYAFLIQAWQDNNESLIEETLVGDSLLPLKLSLLNRQSEAQELLNKIDYQPLENDDKAYLLEAKLFNMPSNDPSDEKVKFAKEIISLLDNAYFANITLAIDHISRKELAQAIESCKTVLTLIPNSEKIISELTILCIFSENRNEAILYAASLKLRMNKVFAKLGLLGLSTKFRRFIVGAVTLVLCMFHPYSLIVLVPLLLLFLVSLVMGFKNRNRLIGLVSLSFISYFGIAVIFCLLLELV